MLVLSSNEKIAFLLLIGQLPKNWPIFNQVHASSEKKKSTWRTTYRDAGLIDISHELRIFHDMSFHLRREINILKQSNRIVMTGYFFFM